MVKIDSGSYLFLFAVFFFFSCDEILDIYPPEIELLSPTEEILTNDAVTFLADATDNIGIERVEFSLHDPMSGDRVKEEISSAPYQFELIGVQSWKQIDLTVKAYDDVGNFALLEKEFLIQTTVENAQITVTSPNGGETWETGSTETITWASSDVSSNVKIKLYQSGSYVSSISSQTSNNGSYTWSIPSSQSESSSYKIRIEDDGNSSVYDYSDNNFSIVGITSNCDTDEIEDCNGECVPQTWLGDGYCDDGTYSYNGIPIYLNCAELNYDNGDCDGGDGGSTVLLEDFEDISDWTNTTTSTFDDAWYISSDGYSSAGAVSNCGGWGYGDIMNKSFYFSTSGTLTFWYKRLYVGDYNHLYLTIDGNDVWDGTSYNWNQVEVDMSAGTHTISFETRFSGTIFLDQLEFTSD